ncbi:MAG: hypothetical protein V3W03_01190 [Gammaproteobacteria bacterium]
MLKGTYYNDMFDHHEYLDEDAEEKATRETLEDETTHVVIYLAGFMQLHQVSICKNIIMDAWTPEQVAYYYQMGTHITYLFYNEWQITKNPVLGVWEFEQIMDIRSGDEGRMFHGISLLNGLRKLEK